MGKRNDKVNVMVQEMQTIAVIHLPSCHEGSGRGRRSSGPSTSCCIFGDKIPWCKWVPEPVSLATFFKYNLHIISI